MQFITLPFDFILQKLDALLLLSDDCLQLALDILAVLLLSEPLPLGYPHSPQTPLGAQQAHQSPPASLMRGAVGAKDVILTDAEDGGGGGDGGGSGSGGSLMAMMSALYFGFRKRGASNMRSVVTV